MTIEVKYFDVSRFMNDMHSFNIFHQVRVGFNYTIFGMVISPLDRSFNYYFISRTIHTQKYEPLFLENYFPLNNDSISSKFAVKQDIIEIDNKEYLLQDLDGKLYSWNSILERDEQTLLHTGRKKLEWPIDKIMNRLNKLNKLGID